MMAAKVQLSVEEMRLVTDPAWILTKNSIVRKVMEMFGDLSGEWRGIMDGVAAGFGPKISRGEQYKGLPWVMLDYPRIFGKEDILAVRTMFWWGHCFSMTLHLKGEYLRAYLPVIEGRRKVLEEAGFEPGMGDDEWEHEHKTGEWESIGQKPFVKISVNIGLDRWNEAPGILTGKFSVLAGILVS